MEKMGRVVLALLLAFSFGFGQEIIKNQSNVGFVGSKFLAFDVVGHFTDYTGKVEVRDGEIKALEATINAASVYSKNLQRDKNIKSVDLLDVEQFPKITFKMDKFEINEANSMARLVASDIDSEVSATEDLKSNFHGKVYGSLNVHGVEKKIVLDASYDKSVLKLEGEVDIKKDFGMNGLSGMSDKVKVVVTLALQ